MKIQWIMKSFWIGLILFFTLIVFGPPAVMAHDVELEEPPPPPDCTLPSVTTTTGPYCGLSQPVSDEGGPFQVDAYLGMEYGTAKRWEYSAPSASSVMQNATAFREVCPQGPGFLGIGIPSEDCLHLNVWAPAVRNGTLLPVMVYIHGGAFVGGSGSDPVYEGGRLAAVGGVVIVTFNYRLGALGALGGGTDDAALKGDYGFGDQQLALKWVHDNIKLFGGDPNQVTIFGESAGAMSVGAHLVAPGSQGLFQAAIMQSNPYGIPFNFTGPNPKNPSETIDDPGNVRTQFETVIQGRPLGIPPVPGGLGLCRNLQDGPLLDCMKTMVTPAQIVAAQKTAATRVSTLGTNGMAGFVAWTPAVGPDASRIPMEPNQAGEPNKAKISVPVIAGTNKDEGVFFAYTAFSSLGSDKYIAALDLLFGEDNSKAIRQQHPAYMAKPVPPGGDNLPALSALLTDYAFTCANRHVLGNVTDQDAYGYSFELLPETSPWTLPPNECQRMPPGTLAPGSVCHTFELPVVFRNPTTIVSPAIEYNFTAAQMTLRDTMTDYWTSFAKVQNPNGSQPLWPAFAPDGLRLVLTAGDFEVITETDDGDANCKFWDGIGYDIIGSRGKSLDPPPLGDTCEVESSFCDGPVQKPKPDKDRIKARIKALIKDLIRHLIKDRVKHRVKDRIKDRVKHRIKVQIKNHIRSIWTHALSRHGTRNK